MFEASFYKKTGNGKVQCQLCPHECIISEGKKGICKIRINNKETLYTSIYNKVAAIHSDPIEKKPLYHFYPGKNILSIGGIGCNFSCDFCQNYTISQCYPDEFNNFLPLSSSQLIDHSLKNKNNIGIAYTYNEPFTFFEFMYDCSREVHEEGQKNIIVSNGFVNPGPLKKIIPYIDAFNIDLKAFNDDFYKVYAKGSLRPVLNSLETIKKNNVHLEITNLVITQINDGEKEFKKMVRWIANELGENTPLHISRYFPSYKMNLPPTSISKMNSMYLIAREHLNFAYLGNVHDTEKNNTYCPECNHLLIERNFGSVTFHDLNYRICKNCSSEINLVNEG